MSKQKPWNIEIYRGFDSDFREEQLLVNTPIREFLDRENKFILLGAKGLGKTLFLRYKSYLYHHKYGESFKFNVTQNELTENLNIHSHSFSKKELLRFREEGLWRLIWELALWIVLFRIINRSMPEGLETLIGKSKQLSNVLAYLLNHRNKINDFHVYVTEFQERKGEIQNGIALFIDDVDQTLQSLLSVPHFTDSNFLREQTPSVEVWVNAQMGLVGAIYNLSRQNGHIKVYATIRREAFEAFESPVKINYLQHISRLEYSKEEIHQIFTKNIHLMDTSELFSGLENLPESRFVGFESLPHRFAANLNGELRQESVFDFIYRHTYGRPRDIVLMGKKISELVSSFNYREIPVEERYEKLRRVVNRVSNDLFEYYKLEVIPYWDDVSMQQFVATVRTNVIPREDFPLFDQDILKLHYNLGLLGYVRPKDRADRLEQVFLPTATYNYRKHLALPDTDFYLVHSTLDTLLLEQHTYGNFYNPYNIIGHGYDFFPRIDNPIRCAEDYFPKDASGNRLRSANQSSGHDFPLINIYQNFFNFEIAQSRYERFQMNWRIFGQILGILGRICYCHRLEGQFRTGDYFQKKGDSILELRQYNFMRKYNSEIPDDQSEKAFDRFQDKLLGRYLVLGCYLVLDLRIEWIHALLTQGHFDFQRPKAKKDTVFAYLSRSFFIRGLRKDEPRDPSNPENRHMKQIIFNHLSIFEQDSIKDFIRNATDEVHYLSWVENEEHKTWMRDKIIQRIWRPE